MAEFETDESQTSDESLSNTLRNCEFCGEAVSIRVSKDEKELVSKKYGLPAVFCSDACRRKFESWVIGRSKFGPKSMRLGY